VTTSPPEVVTIDAEEFYQWRVVLRVPKNWTPESGVFIAVAPPGGIANFPAAVQGEPGLTPIFRYVTVTELDHDDESPMSGEMTIVSPGDADTPPVYDLALTLRRGAPGASGDMSLLGATDLDADDAEDPTAGYVFAVKSLGGGEFGAELVAQKVGNTYWPTSVTVLTNATGANTVASVSIPSQPGPWRPVCHGQQELSPDGADVQVDLVARLNTTTGDALARGLGLANGARQVLALAAAPPVNSVAGYGQIAAGVGPTTILFRCEQVGSGLATYDTTSGRALYSVDVKPV
jgi:hypothetical protein